MIPVLHILLPDRSQYQVQDDSGGGRSDGKVVEIKWQQEGLYGSPIRSRANSGGMTEKRTKR